MSRCDTSAEFWCRKGVDWHMQACSHQSVLQLLRCTHHHITHHGGLHSHYLDMSFFVQEQGPSLEHRPRLSHRDLHRLPVSLREAPHHQAAVLAMLLPGPMVQPHPLVRHRAWPVPLHSSRYTSCRLCGRWAFKCVWHTVVMQNPSKSLTGAQGLSWSYAFVNMAD